MKYYRTKNEIADLRFKYKSMYKGNKTYNAIMDKEHSVKVIGIFCGVDQNCVNLKIDGENDTKPAVQGVISFLSQDILTDTTNHQEVLLYGEYNAQGDIVDVVGLNLNNRYDVKKDVYLLLQEFTEQKGCQPTKVYVPQWKEDELLVEPDMPIEKAAREVFKTICGLEAIYGANDFYVE